MVTGRSSDPTYQSEVLGASYIINLAVLSSLSTEVAHENEPRLAVPSCHGSDELG